jgi:hypothetical protein
MKQLYTICEVYSLNNIFKIPKNATPEKFWKNTIINSKESKY